jgi:uncharacterized protein (TIGR02611 family)
MSDGSSSRAHQIRERLAQRREEHARRGRLYRLLFLVAGVIVTLVGLAMLALPGPAFVVIPIGLAMLAMEFAWAERMLDRALAHADVAQQKAKETTRTQRVLAGIAITLGIAAAIAAVLLWDVPLLPDG